MSVAVPNPIRRSPLTEPISLQNGDRMTRAEFHAAYEQTPEDFKAELIEGIVFVASPLRRNHGVHHVFLSALLSGYWSQTPGVEPGDNCSLLLSDDSEPQPDLYLRVLPEYGGQSKTTPTDYVEGAPELLLEIAISTRSLDLHAKKRVYQRYGVKEYLVAVPLEEKLFWFDLAQNLDLEPLDGVVKSRQFPGLWLDPAAIWRQDHAAAMAVLNQGLASPEHAAFVEQLATKRKA
jgi:Uma2 family endonuclease